jgi:hypothetical protein
MVPPADYLEDGGAITWTAVDRLVGRARSVPELRAHRVHLLAARRWRASGVPVPPDLVIDERRAAVISMTTPALLRRVRAACEGPIVVLKGPELAAAYPDPALRPYIDVDLLVRDPVACQRALLAAGFVAVGDPRLYEGIHHQRPLTIPGLALAVELHASPKWPAGFAPPSAQELFDAAAPSGTGVAGVQTLDRAHHAVVVAAHAWAHDPLRRLGELLDVTLCAHGLDPVGVRAIAAGWGIERLWRTTVSAADALFAGGPMTWPLRTWARHLTSVRDRTVLESHLDRALSPLWASSASVGVAATRRAVTDALLPAEGETITAKLSRARLAIGNAFASQRRHAEEVDDAGLHAPPFLDGPRRERDGCGVGDI